MGLSALLPTLLLFTGLGIAVRAGDWQDGRATYFELPNIKAWVLRSLLGAEVVTDLQLPCDELCISLAQSCCL